MVAQTHLLSNTINHSDFQLSVAVQHWVVVHNCLRRRRSEDGGSAGDGHRRSEKGAPGDSMSCRWDMKRADIGGRQEGGDGDDGADERSWHHYRSGDGEVVSGEDGKIMFYSRENPKEEKLIVIYTKLSQIQRLLQQQ